LFLFVGFSGDVVNGIADADAAPPKKVSLQTPLFQSKRMLDRDRKLLSVHVFCVVFVCCCL
jgi:hypothetical protein